MARSRIRAVGRRERGRFASIPHSVLAHPNYTRLSGNASKLLLEFAYQYNGYNNGKFVVAWDFMKTRGWKSKETLYNALNELVHYGLIVQTRKGRKYAGVKCPSWYATTWEAIDDAGEELKVGPTRLPLSTWMEDRDPWTKPRRPRHFKSQVRTLDNASTDTRTKQAQETAAVVKMPAPASTPRDLASTNVRTLYNLPAGAAHDAVDRRFLEVV